MSGDELWQQVKSVYVAMQSIPPGERESWLQENCANIDVRREVAELLTAEADNDLPGWLGNGNSVTSTLPELPADLEGQTVGRFEIIQRIDSGGMGAVYLARVSEDGREVALKVIQRGLVTDHALARFLRERDILARLDHPAICPLLDSGTSSDGRPFLVMPFLEGAMPITDYCDANNVDIKSKVQLFRQVCNAVQHAHQNLVVHSDIKPGNVLITPDGRVQLVDFGISRLLSPGHEELTRRFGEQRPATLDYASPEQLHGDSPSTLSDIYSLGALLYQVLCGQKAYHIANGDDLRQLQAPPEPSRPKAVSLDLFNICRKAMALEPFARYNSASAVAEDLQRWLDDRPVSARTPSVVYQMNKFIRRHAWPVALAATAMVAIVVLASVLAVNNARINAQAERIALELDRAEATAGFWAHLFAQTDPVASESAVPSVSDLLDRAMHELSTGGEQLSGDIRARLLGVISTSYWNLAQQQRARAAAEQAVAAVEADDVSASTRAMAFKQLANITMAQGDVAAAREAADAALAAMAEASDLSIAKRAQILDAHAGVLEVEGKVEQAASFMEEVVALQQQLPLEDVIVDHATAWGNLALMYFTMAREADNPEPLFERAAEGVAQSLALLQRQFGPDHPRVGFMLNASGALNLERGRLEAALTDFQKAAKIADASLPPGHNMRTHLHHNVGRLNEKLNQYDAAAAAYQQAWNTSAALQPNHPTRVASLLGIIRAHLAADQPQVANDWISRLRDLIENLQPEHAARLWYEVFTHQVSDQPVPDTLLARAQASEDSALLAYLDIDRGSNAY